jgi:hypothetical protein
MDKRKKTRLGLFFGIFMAVSFIIQNLVTEPDLTSKRILIIIASGIVSGALAGFLFGLGMGLLIKFLAKNIKIVTEAGETILFESGANHFKGAEAVGGKLFLTTKRLVFKSHKYNVQVHELSISLPDIDRVDKYKTLGVLNNGLSVETTDHKIEKFVVEQIDEWVNRLAQKNSLQHMPAV